MNISMFYNNLFRTTLGLEALGLENRERELVRMIDTQTVQTFSECVPAKYRVPLDLRDGHNIVRKEFHTDGVEYYIEDAMLDKFNLEIDGIDHIDYNNVGDVDPYDPDSTAYYSSTLAQRNNIDLESVLMGSEYTRNRTLTDSALPWKRYQELRGPRIIYMKNWGYIGNVVLTLKTRWPNVRSIPQEYFEAFTTLAKLDCQRYLWHDLKYYQDVVTPNGNLTLQFDWSGAENDRTDYLKDLRRQSLADRAGAAYFYIL